MAETNLAAEWEELYAHTPNQDNEWHRLADHLLDVASRACRLASKFKMGDFGYAAGLLHDVGKVNPKFQEYLRKCAVDPMELTRTKIPHSVYGCYLCEKDLEFIRPIIAGQHAGIYAMREMADLLNRHRKEAESIQTLAGEFILQHLWHAELPEHTERRIMSGPPSRDTNLNFHVVTGANNALRFSLFPSLNEAVDPAPTQTIR